MTTHPFGIGDTVWVASYERTQRFVVCPDCGGTTRVKVTLFDGTEIMIECGGCNPGGFMPSTGHIEQYDWESAAEDLTVVGSEIKNGLRGNEINYFFLGGRYSPAEFVFATAGEAIAKSEELRLKHETEENERLMSKTKDHKSWSWNYSYHLRMAKRAKAEMELHERKAEICKPHLKSKK